MSKYKPSLLFALILFLSAIFFLIPLGVLLAENILTSSEKSALSYLFSEDSSFLDLCGETIVVCLFSSFWALIFGIPLGFCIFRSNLSFRSIFFLASFSALAIPMHVQASTWIGLFGRGGFLTPFLSNYGEGFSLYNKWGCSWIMGVAYIPLATIGSGMTFLSSNRAIEEEVAMYGSPQEVFWRGTLPQSYLGLFLTGLGIALLALGEMTVTDLLGVNTLVEKMYLLFTIYYQPVQAMYLTIPLLLLSTSGVLFFLVVWRHHLPVSFSLPKASYTYKCSFWSLPFCFFVVTLVWLPLPTLVYMSESWSKWLSVYLAVKTEFWGSIYISGVSALVAAFFSVFFAWAILRRFSFSLFLLLGLFYLALQPPPLLGVGMLRTWKYLVQIPLLGDTFFAFQDSIYILCLGMILRFLPLSILTSLVLMSKIPVEYEETATLEGFSPGQKFFRLVLPISKKALFLSFLIVFVFSLGEVATSVLIVPPGPTTLSIRIFTLLHYGVRADVSSCSLLLILLVLFLSGGVWFFCRNKWQEWF